MAALDPTMRARVEMSLQYHESCGDPCASEVETTDLRALLTAYDDLQAGCDAWQERAQAAEERERDQAAEDAEEHAKDAPVLDAADRWDREYSDKGVDVAVHLDLHEAVLTWRAARGE